MQGQDIKQIITQEYIKCAKDPAYFMRKYCYIQHPQRGRILFNLYPFQEKVLHLFRDNENILVLKSRQLGISTLAAGYSLWMMTFHKDKNILALATTQTTARNLVTKVIFMYEQLPKWLQLPFAEKNKLSLRLNNGSRITAKSSNANSARSEAVSLLLIDEAAFIDNIEETYTAAQQTLATGGQCMALSCVTADTYIYTDKGLKQIKDFIKSNHTQGFNTVDSYKVLGKDKVREGSLFYHNGQVPTKVIKTRYASIEGSFNHKLYAHTERGWGWRRLDELKQGDYIGIQGGVRVWGSNDSLDFIEDTSHGRKQLPFNTGIISEDLSYYMGLYLAEGSSDGKTCIDITCGDQEDTSVSILKLGLGYTQTEGSLAKRVCSTSLVEYLNLLGFKLGTHKAHTKEIPSRILELSEKNIAALLRGMFDGDGSVTEKGLITYTSTSEKLVDQVRALLLNFGIYSRKEIRTAEEANNYVDKKVKEGKEWAKNWNIHRHDAYILEIYGESVKTYNKFIGFSITRKQKKLDKYLEDSERKVRTNTFDVIPNGVELILTLQKLSGLSKRAFIKESKVTLYSILNEKNPRTFTNVSKGVFLRVFEKWKHLLDRETREQFEDLSRDTIRWIPIINIQENINNTYDFSLPENPLDKWDHSVTYNGILGHQTPNGIGNWFHKTWERAENGENSFLPIKLPWTVHPERDQTWRDAQDAELGPKMAAQECLEGSTIITVQNTLTGEISEIPLKDLYSRLSDEKEQLI